MELVEALRRRDVRVLAADVHQPVTTRLGREGAQRIGAEQREGALADAAAPPLLELERELGTTLQREQRDHLAECAHGSVLVERPRHGAFHDLLESARVEPVARAQPPERPLGVERDVPALGCRALEIEAAGAQRALQTLAMAPSHDRQHRVAGAEARTQVAAHALDQVVVALEELERVGCRRLLRSWRLRSR